MDQKGLLVHRVDPHRGEVGPDPADEVQVELPVVPFHDGRHVREPTVSGALVRSAL